MKNRLITLLTKAGTVVRATDRKGVYSLRYVNHFPKFGPAAHVAAAGPLRAGHSAPSAQPSLFEPPKAPVTAAPKNGEGPADPGSQPERTERTERTKRTDRADPPHRPAAGKVRFRWFAKLRAFLGAAVAFFPKTAARIRGRRRAPAADSRPRAQGELVLEKVTVLRNDLSDADLMVVAVQPKPEDSRAAPAEPRKPAGNPWKRVTARWVKLKNPAEGGGLASVAPEAPAGRAADWAQTPPCNPC